MRPSPHWISSKMSAAPTASHASRAAASTSWGSGQMPPSPCTGSIRTAAVRSFTAAVIASAVGSTAMNPGTSGANGACLASCGVALSAPMVRPWNARCATTMSPPRLALRASLSAASTASAPEFVKNTRPPSELSARRSASRAIGSV